MCASRWNNATAPGARLFDPQQLDGDVPLEAEVTRAMDFRRTVTPDRLQELVVRDAHGRCRQ